VERPTDGALLYQVAFVRSTTEALQAGWSQTWTESFRTDLRVNRVRLLPLIFPSLDVVPGSPTSAVVVPILHGQDPGLKTGYDLLASTTEQAVFQANWDPSEALHAVVGLDSTRLKVARTPIGGLLADRVDSATGGFLSLDWSLGAAAFSLGARAENDSLGGSRISPRATLVYRLQEQVVLRAGYYTSTRSPQVSELVQDTSGIPGRPGPLGNPGLRPETFDSFELGCRMTWAAWSLDVTAFHMMLKQVIAPEPTGAVVGTPPLVYPQTRFQNGGARLRNRGVEVSLKGELSPGWRLGFNATALDFKDEAGMQAAYAPRLSANLWSRYRLQGFRFYAALQQVGGCRRVDKLNLAGPSEEAPSRLQVHVHLGHEWDSGFRVSLYGINAARPFDESTAGATNNSHLVRFSRRELGIQAAYRF
jgi:outer membrane receptor protein involved in Fe transport